MDSIANNPLPGAYRLETYLSEIQGKNVGIVANNGSLIGKKNIVDTLLDCGIKISKIFSPEHGFRGKADAGEKVNNSKENTLGIEIVSLYGKNKKPSKQQLEGIDIMLFYLQDVGVRFYTYISTLTYVMEACAESNISIIVLDCPNPNGSYVDGPVLEKEFSSFIGMHPVPVVYGMTIGEYARMVNGEHWIDVLADLTVVKCLNYTHESKYHLPINPSPNLRSDDAIAWYPSLCFFEGTVVSAGRGTPTPFEVVGHPLYPDTSYSFTPHPDEGAKKPKLNGKKCYGVDFRGKKAPKKLFLAPFLAFYQKFPDKNNFFLSNGMFDLLAGTDQLRKQIVAGKSIEEIRLLWQPTLVTFKKIRAKYLLYD